MASKRPLRRIDLAAGAGEPGVGDIIDCIYDDGSAPGIAIVIANSRGRRQIAEVDAARTLADALALDGDTLVLERDYWTRVLARERAELGGARWHPMGGGRSWIEVLWCPLPGHEVAWAGLTDPLRRALFALEVHPNRRLPHLNRFLPEHLHHELLTRGLAKRSRRGQVELRITERGTATIAGLFAGHRWWSCIVGTTWRLLDAEVRPKDARARVRATLFEGGIVRPATAAEVAAWEENEQLTKALRGARTNEQRLAVLATDALGIVQPAML